MCVWALREGSVGPVLSSVKENIGAVTAITSNKSALNLPDRGGDPRDEDVLWGSPPRQPLM